MSHVVCQVPRMQRQSTAFKEICTDMLVSHDCNATHHSSHQSMNKVYWKMTEMLRQMVYKGGLIWADTGDKLRCTSQQLHQRPYKGPKITQLSSVLQTVILKQHYPQDVHIVVCWTHKKLVRFTLSFLRFSMYSFKGKNRSLDSWLWLFFIFLRVIGLQSPCTAKFSYSATFTLSLLDIY